MANRYRFGFNGKENDVEAVGTGEGTQDYGMRIYNPAIGKFLSVDPLTNKFPWWTPYQFAGNMPIKAVDLDGAEIFIPQTIPLEPIITIPKSIPLSMPRIGPIPPVVAPMPNDITSGQPNVDMADNHPTDIDWNSPPSDPESLSKEWEETTHPDNKSGSRDFKHKKTGDEIRFDPGKDSKSGWEGKNHWHRLNPLRKNRHDEYLDKNGNPVKRGSDPSHIEAPKAIILPEIEVKPKNWIERTWDKVKEFFKPAPKKPADDPNYA